MKVDDIIREKLTKKEVHKLLSLCKMYFPLPLHILEGQEEYLESNKKNALGNNCFKKLVDIRKIHTLYQKAGVDESNYLAHWTVQRSIHKIESDKYNAFLKPERKDNKTYINRGSGHSNRNPTRYPKKVRKTAWKRFYRLFPSLDPEREKKLNEELTMF
jgi:hypothetical protein